MSKSKKMVVFFVVGFWFLIGASAANAISINFNGTIETGLMVTYVNPTDKFDITLRDLTGLAFSGTFEADAAIQDPDHVYYNNLQFHLTFDGIWNEDIMSFPPYEMSPDAYLDIDQMILHSGQVGPVGVFTMELTTGQFYVATMDAMLLDPIAGNFSFRSSDVNYTVNNPVPEPTSMFLLGTGLLGLAGFRKKLKRNG